MSDENSSVFVENWTDNDGNPAGGVASGFGFTISWQNGPLGVTGGRNGAFLLDLMAVCKRRLEHYQNSRFACQENAEALEDLSRAIQRLKDRRDRRQADGTLGTHEGK